MADILIHAGNLKTGSTAIQSVLKKMRPDLAQRGVVMLNLEPRQGAYYAVANAWRRNAGSEANGAADDLALALRQTDASAVPLLTAETFMSADPSRMRDLIASADRQPRLLFYVRPHAGLLASLYLQLVKIGKFAAPVDAVARQMMRLSALRFIDVIDGFGEVFGHDAITVREFSRDRLVDGSIVADFWDAFALPADLLQKAVTTEQVSNPTPTLELSILLRALRLHLAQNGTPDDRMRQPVLAFFRAAVQAGLPGQPFRLPLALQHELAETWDKPRAAFAERWFKQKPTGGWLSEAVVAPTLPQPVSMGQLKGIAASVARRAERNEKILTPQHADQIRAFIQGLPRETQSGEPVVDITALDEHLTQNRSATLRKRAGGLARGPGQQKHAVMSKEQEV